MFCRECGKPHADDAMFCPSCGAKIIAPGAGRNAPAPVGKKTAAGKKPVALAVIVIVLLVVAGAGVYYVKFARGAPAGSAEPVIAPEETTLPAPAARTTAATHAQTSRPAVVVPTPTEVTVPATGVWVRVDYLGGWTGSYGKAGALVTVADSGLRQYQVENPTGSIQASFRKDDSSSHDLTVEIYRNGAVIKRGNTILPRGTVDISVTA
jgi:hypothetical protein